MRYYKFPKWLKRFFPEAIWEISFLPPSEKNIFLTFDDGPNPITTDWLLDLLDEYNAKATFFCLGKNVDRHPQLYKKYLEKGHTVGNHSYSHLNGFFTGKHEYLEDIEKAAQFIDSKLFRPPYGKFRPGQHKALKQQGYTSIMWSHISYDFDPGLKSEKRLKKTLEAGENGSIIIFHDSDKAYPQLKEELPQLLKQWHQMGFTFKGLNSFI